MSGFLKLLRPEKVNKIAKEIYKALEEKGQQVSLAKMSVDLLSLQAEQDPLAVQSKI
jgi:arginine repressor